MLVGGHPALLGIVVRQDQGRVHVHDQQLNVGVDAGGPYAGAGMLVPQTDGANGRSARGWRGRPDRIALG